jgi:hypothetical protein
MQSPTQSLRPLVWLGFVALVLALFYLAAKPLNASLWEMVRARWSGRTPAAAA